jgi:hypothetical protein
VWFLREAVGSVAAAGSEAEALPVLSLKWAKVWASEATHARTGLHSVSMYGMVWT